MATATLRWWWVPWGLGGLLIALGLLGLDRAFYEQVSQRLNTENNPFDRDFYTVTRPIWLAVRFGGPLVGMFLLFLAATLRPAGWRLAGAALGGVLAAVAVANVAQGVIGRLRPNQATTHLAFTQPTLNPLTKQCVSFPSGEATGAFALAVVLSRLFPRGRIGFHWAAVLVAGARLMNGAHYLSDVAAGALLGRWLGAAVFAWVAARATSTGRPKRNGPGD